ncbi:hypothetical protein HII31_12494 [Pseudocercospora fuligena]|uniref:Uncharacterized protein n=1 Tax=Pseudocercospora fuligena TaxID=685502 RepID=A0A8H6R988_9PEZI|nr:hypothetical protein HII31_12494 [Pseudocercospora fuligena]
MSNVVPAVSLSAGARVAGIPELLEQILLNLVDVHKLEPRDRVVGPLTVLLSQRTSQAFRDTIIGSGAIQRALRCQDAKQSTTGHSRLNLMLGRPIAFYGRRINFLTVNLSLEYRNAPPNLWIVREPRGVRVTVECIRDSWPPSQAELDKHSTPSWRQMHILSEIGTLPIIKLEGIIASKLFTTIAGNWENPTLGEICDLLREAGKRV